MQILLLIGCIHVLITMTDAQRDRTTTTRRRRVKASPTTISLQEFMFKQREAKDKKFRFKYNPNFGYEPYWVEGSFVLTTFKEDLERDITTTKMPLVCGDECNYLLQKVKHVCAHKSNDHPLNGCYGIYCTGKPGQDLSWKFRTFNTYCEFLDAQCRDPFTRGRYILVHVGKCVHIEQTFKPMWEGWQPVERLKKQLTEFYSRFPKTAKINTEFFFKTTHYPY